MASRRKMGTMFSAAMERMMKRREGMREGSPGARLRAKQGRAESFSLAGRGKARRMARRSGY